MTTTDVHICADHLHGRDAHYDGPATTEGLWHELTGKSWMFSDGNPTAMKYAIRSAIAGLPTDNDVHYVKVGPIGHLVHGSEIVVKDQPGEAVDQ